MPARVVVILDTPEVAEQVVAELRANGHDALPIADPMVALDELERAVRIELLVTGIDLGSGKPNGLALARMARMKRPGIKVLFVGLGELAGHAEGLGRFVAGPVSGGEIAEISVGMLAGEG